MKVPRGDQRPPLAVAYEWVSQVTTVVMEMVLPGVAGQWLDRRWGTKFIGLVGFALGLTVGILHLVAMSRPRSGASSSRQPDVADKDDSPNTPSSTDGPGRMQD